MVEKANQIPESFICPLSGKLMTDPVLDREGNSFERTFILDHLQITETNPLDPSQALRASDLAPNKALKKAIDDFVAKSFINPDIVNQELEAKANILIDLDLQVSSYGDNSLISIIPPKEIQGFKRTAVSICCVIDISGSMGSEANIKNEAGKSEAHGFTVLDLVKHALKTIIQSLDEGDNLALVSFDSVAKVDMKMTKMDSNGKKTAERAVDLLDPDGSTNIWAGLETGLNVIKSADVGKNTALLLLTDGQPVVVPPRGHLAMLKRYRDECGGNLPAVINTFGFGNTLDCMLLNELASEGNGAFAFIPDGSFVGTIFINALSSILNVAACDVTLRLKNTKAEEVPLLRHHEKILTPQSDLILKLGSVTFGQPKDLVVPKSLLQDRGGLQVELTFSSPFQSRVCRSKTLITVINDDKNAEIQRLRLESVTTILDIVSMKLQTDLKEQERNIQDLIQKIKSSSVSNEPYIKDLLIDLQEQVSIALSTDEFYSTWGRNYLFSLSKAHLLQICNNFKDPGVQHFGGDRFNALRDLLDSIFLKIPAPKPTFKQENVAPLASMSVYNNRYGVCFAGDCLVKMADQSTKFVKELKKGDAVLSDRNITAKILCVIVTKTFGGKAPMVELSGGLRITPWHPIRIKGKFIFPTDIEEPKVKECALVYNFVLDQGHILTVNGVECLTLAHSFREAIAEHEYFGTQRVLEDLKQIEGWVNGRICLNWDDVVRDTTSGLIIGIRSDKKIQINPEDDLGEPLKT